MKKMILALCVVSLMVSCQTGNNPTMSILMPQPATAAVQNQKKVQSTEAQHRLAAAYKNQDWPEVVSAGEEIVKSGKPLGVVSTLYAEGLAAVGRSEEAVTLLRDSIAHNPKDYYLVQTLGNIYMFIQNYPEARKCFDRVIELNPMYARPFIYNGDIMSRDGDFIGAAASYMSAVYLFIDGRCWQDCETYSQRVIDLYPLSDDYYRAWLTRAVANWHLNQTEKYEEARKMVESVAGEDGMKLLKEFCADSKK